MRSLLELLERLDAGPVSAERAVSDHLATAPAADAAWSLHLLRGTRGPRRLHPAALAEHVRAHEDIPRWLFDESRSEAGNLVETAVLLGSSGQRCEEPFADMMDRVVALDALTEDARLTTVLAWLERYDAATNRVLLTLACGRSLVRVPDRTLIRAVASAFDLERSTVAFRLSRGFEPTAASFASLTAPDEADARDARPFAFEPIIDGAEAGASDVTDSIFEHEPDGVRAQLVRRDDVHLWSEEMDLLSERFPSIAEDAQQLPPGTVLDGYLVVFENGCASRGALEALLTSTARRRGDHEAAFIASDVLEHEGEDVRTHPLGKRRSSLARMLPLKHVTMNEELSVASTTDRDLLRETCRESGACAIIERRVDARYGEGRRRWIAEPHRLLAVLLYVKRAARGDTGFECGFGVRAEDDFLPIARVRLELDAAEREQLDSWIADHVRERFGPVRQLDAELVFELEFDGVVENRRTKSGLALRNPRCTSWRRDLAVDEANRIEEVRRILTQDTSLKNTHHAS